MAVFTTTRGTASLAGTLGADRLVRSVNEEIFLMEANAMPLTAMSRGLRKKTVAAIKTEWVEDNVFNETATVNGTVTSTTTTAITVDTPGGNYFDVDDLIWNPTSGEIYRCIAQTSATSIGVERSFGTVAATANIADGETLLRIGNAMAQGSNTPGYKQTVEVFRSNHIQRFRKAFALTKEAMNSSVYGENLLPYQKRKTLLELLREVEYANFFGQPVASSGVVEGAAATVAAAGCGGLKYYLDTNAPSSLKVDASGTWTQAEFLDWIREVYLHKGPHSQGTKVIYSSPALIKDLEGYAASDIRVTPRDTKFGVKVREWQTTWGDVTFVPHPMLKDPAGSNGNFAFMVDMQELAQVTQKNMDLEYKEIMKEDSTGQEILVGEWKISQCLEIKGSGNGVDAAVHGYVYNIPS